MENKLLTSIAFYTIISLANLHNFVCQNCFITDPFTCMFLGWKEGRTFITEAAAFSAMIAHIHLQYCTIGLALPFTVSDGILPNHMMLIRLHCHYRKLNIIIIIRKLHYWLWSSRFIFIFIIKECSTCKNQFHKKFFFTLFTTYFFILRMCESKMSHNV